MKINIRNHRFTGVFFRCLFLFLIVFLTGTVFLYKFGVYPFGDNSLMGMDLYDQYFPMYYQQSHLNSISGLFHSWNGSLGYNNWVQSAYYCNSIFLPLFRLIPNEYLVDLTDWLIITKIALSAVTCLIYLEYKTGRPSPLLMGGAAAYSLCGYTTAYMLQIMWTDLLLYTPLVLLGLERLLQKKEGNFLYAAPVTLHHYQFLYCVQPLSVSCFLCSVRQHPSAFHKRGAVSQASTLHIPAAAVYLPLSSCRGTERFCSAPCGACA